MDRIYVLEDFLLEAYYDSLMDVREPTYFSLSHKNSGRLSRFKTGKSVMNQQLSQLPAIWHNYGDSSCSRLWSNLLDSWHNVRASNHLAEPAHGKEEQGTTQDNWACLTRFKISKPCLDLITYTTCFPSNLQQNNYGDMHYKSEHDIDQAKGTQFHKITRRSSQCTEKIGFHSCRVQL